MGGLLFQCLVGLTSSYKVPDSDLDLIAVAVNGYIRCFKGGNLVSWIPTKATMAYKLLTIVAL